MKVGTRQGECNNSPAESTSPENGWRSSETPKPNHWSKCDASMPLFCACRCRSKWEILTFVHFLFTIDYTYHLRKITSKKVGFRVELAATLNILKTSWFLKPLNIFTLAMFSLISQIDCLLYITTIHSDSGVEQNPIKFTICFLWKGAPAPWPTSCIGHLTEDYFGFSLFSWAIEVFACLWNQHEDIVIICFTRTLVFSSYRRK